VTNLPKTEKHTQQGCIKKQSAQGGTLSGDFYHKDDEINIQTSCIWWFNLGSFYEELSQYADKGLVTKYVGR
jgi:hypothetical protein